MIEVLDLDFRYTDGGFILRIPRLSVTTGSTVAVVGPRGCAKKTTLLNLVAGIALPHAGALTPHHLRPALLCGPTS